MAYLRGINSPPVAPTPYTPWKRVQHLFYGWDGSVWDVTDGRDGVFLMPEGIEGMGMPKIDNFTFDSPVVHGSEWVGWRASGRDVFWVIGIFEDSSTEWLEMKTAFWKIFRPGKVLRWEVVLPNGERYSLNVRFSEDHTSAYSRDPVRLGWAIYGISAITEQPFWSGTPISQMWFPPNDQNFYGATGYGPPFYVASSADFDNALLNNPGDVETYIRWELTGPFTTATVGIGDATTTVGSTLAGSTVILDTDPLKLTATRNGTNIMSTLGEFEYAPLPPGKDIVLNMAMNGTGTIRASYTPLYLRSI